MDAVEGAYTPGRGVREQAAVEKHDPADEVESEKHGDGQHHVHRHYLLHRLPTLGQHYGPVEGEVAGDGVDGADEDLHEELDHAAPGDGDAPVLHAVVHSEQLHKSHRDTG